MSNFGMSDMGEYHDPSLRLEKPHLATIHDHQHLVNGELVDDVPNTEIHRDSVPINASQGAINRRITPVPDIEGRDASPYQEALRQRRLVTRYIIHSITAEQPYNPEIEWEVWSRANELEERNMLPTGTTADDIVREFGVIFDAE